MKTSAAGRAIVCTYEGLKLKAYTCPAGLATIGYGHTKGVKLGMTCTPDQADEWLADDLGDAERAIARLVNVPLTQGQFDALASFIFNLGEGSFAKSTMLKLLNAGEYSEAAKQFSRWVHSNGKRLNGLVRRRAAEADLFMKP